MGNVDNVAELADILGCGTSSIPLKYLAMPLGACYKAKSIWDALWKRWNTGWPDGKGYICLRVARLPLSITLFPIYLRTFCLSFPFLLWWPFKLRSSNEIFYGEE
jgi:hypothetical protein